MKCFLLAFGVAASQALAQSAAFVPLGHLPGPFPASTGGDVSRHGDVVVGSSRSYVGFWGEAFRWSESSGMIGLGLLPGHKESNAGAVSPEGDWVVGHGVASPEEWEAFAWSPATGMLGLGDLPGGDFHSVARSVSHNGRAIVGNGSTDTGGREHSEAFVWTAAAGMQGIGTLGGGNPSSTASDVSADGHVVVGGSSSALGGQAFRWTADEGMVGLGALDAEHFSSGARGVSKNGRWIVGSSRIAIENGHTASQAVLWDPQGDILGLGWLQDSRDRYSFAYDVSDDGSMVVGRAGGVGMADTAFLWTPDHGMRPLVDVLRDDYGLDIEAMGWHLDLASGITPDGRTIVGSGMNPDGYSEAWMVRLVPAPSTVALAFGTVLAASRRRRTA